MRKRPSPPRKRGRFRCSAEAPPASFRRFGAFWHLSATHPAGSQRGHDGVELVDRLPLDGRQHVRVDVQGETETLEWPSRSETILGFVLIPSSTVAWVWRGSWSRISDALTPT